MSNSMDVLVSAQEVAVWNQNETASEAGQREAPEEWMMVWGLDIDAALSHRTMGVMGVGWERGGAWRQGLLRAGRVSPGPTTARLVCDSCLLPAVYNCKPARSNAG